MRNTSPLLTALFRSRLFLFTAALLLAVLGAHPAVSQTPPVFVITQDSSSDDNVAGSAPLGEGWVVTPVFTPGFVIGTSFGPGRNDDVVRLYLTQLGSPNSTIREVTFDDDESAWSNTSTIPLPFYSERALALGAGRNDDVLRLYSGSFFVSDNAELTWTGDEWARTSLGLTGQQHLNLAVGPGRDDGVTRLYFSTGSGSPGSPVAREFSYTGTNWSESPIPHPIGGAVGSFGIDLGDGRNDGVTRVYEGVLGPANWFLYEFSWSGTAWVPTQIAQIGSQIMAVAVGDGRNDGVNRVYVVARNSGVSEYSYEEGAWSLTASVPDVGPEVFDVALGPGRNDLVNRLYIVQRVPGRLSEATFDGEAWSVATVGNPGGDLFRVRVGIARNDKITRVYAAGSGGLFEVEHTAKLVGSR